VSVRIGVHTGPALRIADGYFGSNVILSARVAEQAAPGEILVSAAIVQRLVARRLPVDAGRWVALKGIPEASLVFSLHWRPRKAPRVRPAASSTAHAAMVHTLGRPAESRPNDDNASCMLRERGGA
jgi:class 3 adenylate cyclase